MTEETNTGRAFPPTTWGAITTRPDETTEQRLARYDVLIRRYWPPVFFVLHCCERRPREDAMDLTQAFFAHLLDHPVIERYDPELGRFRTFLRATLRRFLQRADRDAFRGRPPLRSLDAMRDWTPPTVPDRAEEYDRVFDREWISANLTLAIDEMRRRLTSDGRELTMRAFDRHDLAVTRGQPVPRRADVARELGITEGALHVRLREARETFRSIVAELVRETCARDEDVNDEVRRVLGR